MKEALYELCATDGAAEGRHIIDWFPKGTISFPSSAIRHPSSVLIANKEIK